MPSDEDLKMCELLVLLLFGFWREDRGVVLSAWVVETGIPHEGFGPHIVRNVRRLSRMHKLPLDDRY